MPFTRVSTNDYVSPSGRHFTRKQVRLYYATNGFGKGVDKKMKALKFPAQGKTMKKMFKKKAVDANMPMPRKGMKPTMNMSVEHSPFYKKKTKKKALDGNMHEMGAEHEPFKPHSVKPAIKKKAIKKPSTLAYKGKKKGRQWTQAQDDAWDKKHNIKEGSPADMREDRAHGIKDKKKRKQGMDTTIEKRKKKSSPIKHTGSFQGKSNRLGYGGRAAQMRARGVPGGVIGENARREGAAPGGPNYHGGKPGGHKKSTRARK